MKAKTVKEVLVAAQWMLKNVGWCQGDFAKSGNTIVWMGAFTTLKNAMDEVSCDHIDAFCSIGAINAVEANRELKKQAIELLGNATGDSSITQWNDNEKRTKKQVLAAFNKAIAGAE